ncbi:MULTISPECIES: phage major capsid protein [Sphingomonas]|uniref:Phage major capsid protein n=1 Tax=Sphingomonas molluscorum TaxID=418184 RepID=A0ABU8Q7J3_9SPHN|nr:phage major capsid protein [Sphingomonas sp. JUb134]MBM7407062.1 HK97 family phage major capsid protein [Sphingomonas sp. JUb134]
MNIKALRDQRADKARQARNLLDTNTGDKFTKEIENQVDGLYAEIDRIDAQIERYERQAEIDGNEQLEQQQTEIDNRARAGMTQEQREGADRYNAAFRNFLMVGERGLSNEEMTVLRTGIARNEQSGQQSNAGAGGYLVPTGWGGRLLEALAAFGGMRDAATIIQTAGGAPIPWPTIDDTTAEGEIVAENQPASDDELEFGSIEIGAYKYSSKVFTVPFELIQDQGPGMDIEAFIRRAAAMRIARISNRHFTTGTGINQPRGIVTASAAGKIGAVGAPVDHDSLVDLEHSVDPAYRSMPGTAFMFHDTTLRELKKLKDSEGRPLWVPGVSTKEPDVLLGYRYRINQHMPVAAPNAKSILFGNLKEYLIRDTMQVTLFRFDDSTFTRKGQVGFLAWSRHDGDLMSAGAPVKHYQHGPNA